MIKCTYTNRESKPSVFKCTISDSVCTLGTLNLYSPKVTALVYQKALCVYKPREWFVQPTYTKINVLQ